MVPWGGVAAVATENATVPASPATHPATKAATGGCGQSTSTALSTATAVISHGTHVGPKMLRLSKIAEKALASTMSMASAQRPSTRDLRRHAHTAPMPTSAAMAGASATV